MRSGDREGGDGMASAFERIYTALLATGYEVAQRPVQGTGDVYLSYFMLSQREVMRSDSATRLITRFQVDIFSRWAAGPEEIGAVRGALRQAGFAISMVGPATYEDDTRWHHLVIECEGREALSTGS